MGAWLGLVSGGVILIAGQAAAFLPVNPLGTVITVLVKGTLCGLIAGLVYTALSKKNQWLAIIMAAIVCPVVNTGVFLLGCLVFFMETLNGWAAALGRSIHDFGPGGRQLLTGDRRKCGAGSGDLPAYRHRQEKVRRWTECC